MKTITAYQSEDGEIHTKEIDALRSDSRIIFEKWYKNNTLRFFKSQNNCVTDSNSFHDWLVNNRKYLLEFLNGGENEK